MPDEMDEAHRRDTRYEHALRAARTALEAVLAEERAGRTTTDRLETAVDCLTKEMDHIVARWN